MVRRQEETTPRVWKIFRWAGSGSTSSGLVSVAGMGVGSGDGDPGIGFEGFPERGPGAGVSGGPEGGLDVGEQGIGQNGDEEMRPGPVIDSFRISGCTAMIDRLFRERRSCFEGDQKEMSAILIGILSQEKIRERMLAIARGEYRPSPDEPGIWFTSMKSLAEVLSDENRALLKVIAETEPQSITQLASETGRKPGNLSRTLKTMANYGIVDLKRVHHRVRPIARATTFQIVTG